MEEEKQLKRTANATQKIYDDNKQETTDTIGDYNIDGEHKNETKETKL